MAKIMDPILTILSILGYWAIILGSFGGPGMYIICTVGYLDPQGLMQVLHSRISGPTTSSNPSLASRAAAIEL